MSSHNDPNSSDEKAEETEMERIRRRYAAHTSRLHTMRTLPLGESIPGNRRVRRPQLEDNYEEEYEEYIDGGEDGGGDMLGLEIPSLPPQPNLGKGKPFSPRRDFSFGSSLFKRKREPQESPEIRRASAPSLRQGVFPQAPILGRAATDGLHRLMIQGPRGSQRVKGLGLGGRRESSNRRLRLGSQNQGLGFGGVEKSFGQPQQYDDSRKQPQSQDQPHGLGFLGFGQSISRPQYEPLSRQQPQSLDQGPSFVWEPGVARLGSLLGFPPVNYIEDSRARVANPREIQNFALRAGGGSHFLPPGFPSGRGRPTHPVAPPRQGTPFLGAQDLPSFGEANDHYDHSSVPSSWSSPDAGRSPTHRLPTSVRPPTEHGPLRVTNPLPRLLPQPPNNPWQNQPNYKDEEEEDSAIRPNERRRLALGQQPFISSFHQQAYSQEGRIGDSAAAFPPANRNNSLPNDHMGRPRAPGAELLRDRRAREREESKQRLRHSRLHQTRFGDKDEEEYDGDGLPHNQDQISGARQLGIGEGGPFTAPRQTVGFGAHPAMRSTQVVINFKDEKDEDEDDDEGDGEGERLKRILASSARHGEEQSRPAHPFGRPAQQPDRTVASSRPRRLSSVSVHTSGLPSTEVIGLPQHSRQRVKASQRLRGFMQHTQVGRRRVLNGSSTGADTSRPSSRQSFFQRALRGVPRGGSLRNQVDRGRGGLGTRVRGGGRGAPFSMGGQSALPNNDNWSGPPRRPPRSIAMNPFAGRDMDGGSSADEAPAPPHPANVPMGGRGRGGALITGSNARQQPAINHNSVIPAPQGRGRAHDTSATTAMAGLGLGIASRNEAPRNTLPHPYAPPGVQQTGFFDDRAVYPLANGGMMVMPGESIPPAPKLKLLSKLDQLRAQAAAQMEAIQAKLKAAEEGALAEEAAQMDLDAELVRRVSTIDDIWEVEDRDDGEVDSESERSTKPIKMGKRKNRGKGKSRAPSDMVDVMKAASGPMGLEGDDEIDVGGDDRDGNPEHAARVRQLRMPMMVKAPNGHFGLRNEDIDEYEAGLMTEDEDAMDGERMAREAQRILDEQRAAEQTQQLDPNIYPRLQAQPSPPPPTGERFLRMIPPQFQHWERELDPNDPGAWIADNDDEVNHQQQENDDTTIAEGSDKEYDEYDSEWEEDLTGEDDAADLAALARPVANIADTYSTMNAFGIQANPTHLALSLSLERGFGDDDPDLIQPRITNWKAPRKKARGGGDLVLVPKTKFTFFESLGEYPELMFELCKRMDPKDLVTLYCIQKDFHETVNGNITHVVKSCARYYAAESARVYPHGMYKSLCIRDPAMRKDPRSWGGARWIPGLKWLQMVAHRERTVRDILACLARAGHRTAKSMPLTVKKIWLIMDIATTAQRISLCHNETWFTDIDCYNAQFFIIKLLLMFNESMSQQPVDDGMMRVFLGQRGLTPLCKLLKREKYLNDHEIMKLCIKYSYYPVEEHKVLQMSGVKPEDIGKGHLEGWGKGKIHLIRIDEILMRELTRRKLNLDDNLLYLMLWGHVDLETGKDIQPSYEEMYMSDEEDAERKRQKDLEKLRRGLIKEGREMIKEGYRGQKRKPKKAKHEQKLLSHKQLLAKEYADKGFKKLSVEEWDKQAEVDEERANWFMDHNHPQRSMSANDVPFYTGKNASDAVDYFDIGDEDLPDSEVVSAYESLVYDSDGDSQASSLLDYALVSLVSPGHSASESEYEAFDEFREFDPTQEWSSDNEDHPRESLILDARDSGTVGWVKDQKGAEDEPLPVVKSEFRDPVEEDEWWCTTSEDSGERGEDGDDHDL